MVLVSFFDPNHHIHLVEVAAADSHHKKGIDFEMNTYLSVDNHILIHFEEALHEVPSEMAVVVLEPGGVEFVDCMHQNKRMVFLEAVHKMI